MTPLDQRLRERIDVLTDERDSAREQARQRRLEVRRLQAKLRLLTGPVPSMLAAERRRREAAEVRERLLIVENKQMRKRLRRLERRVAA